MSVDGNSGNKNPPDETDSPVRYTVPPGVESLITLKTLPNSTCYLRLEDDSTADYILKLYADQDGIIRFHVRPDIEAEVIAKLVVKSELDNKLMKYPLELRSSFKSTNEMPFPVDETPIPSQSDAHTRPAISEEEMLNLSDKEVLERGYPPRPNPYAAPEAFDTWKRIVSIPMTVVKPQVVTNHGVTASNHFHTSNRIWSGYVLRDELRTGGWRKYSQVKGAWRVPSVKGGGGNRTHSVLWVGLDGWVANDDLVQAGTGQDCTEVKIFTGPPFNLTIPMSFTNYYAWKEFLPQEKYMQVITSFPVYPGNEIYVAIWMGRPKEMPDLAGDAIFWILNTTTGKQTTVTTSRFWTDPNGNSMTTVVEGLEADWIMEAPSYYGGFPADLANYATAIITVASASPTDTSAAWIHYQSGASLQVTMMNGGNKLSTVEPIDFRSMRFTWHAFY
jgi:hypothetical protein